MNNGSGVDIQQSVQMGMARRVMSKERAFTSSLERTANGKASPEELKKLATDFESIIVHMMLKTMRGTVGEDPLFGKSNQVDTYRSLLDEEYAEKIAERGGFGFADMLYKQLLEQSPQGGADPEDGSKIKEAK